MTTIKNVVLIGGGGNLGSAILQTLLSNPTFSVTVLSRTESQSVFPATVKAIKTDYSLTHLTQIFQGQHAVINASNLAAVSQQFTIIDACVAAGVYRYITNDFGNPSDFVSLPELDFLQQPRREVRDYVKRQAQAQPQTSSSPFTWTALATGFFTDRALTVAGVVTGFDIPTRAARLISGGTEPFSSTIVADVALAVSNILLHPDQTANKHLVVRTVETTQLDILQAFEAQMSTKWSVEHVSADELHESGKAKLKSGDVKAAIMDLLAAQTFEPGVGRCTLPRERYDNELLGVQEKSIDDIVRGVLADM